MMIPGEWEDRPRSAAGAEPSVPAPRVDGRAAVESRPPQRRELPGWLKVSIFAATLLAATWLVMLLEATTR
jgi:hypothetical protein